MMSWNAGGATIIEGWSPLADPMRPAGCVDVSSFMLCIRPSTRVMVNYVWVVVVLVVRVYLLLVGPKLLPLVMVAGHMQFSLYIYIYIKA